MFKMNTMTQIFVSLLLISIYINYVVSAIGDPTAKITFTKIAVQHVVNPYTEAWHGEIIDSGARITLNIPLKADLPPGMMLKGVATFNGLKVANVDMPVCEAFKDELFVRTILDAGMPKDKFPKSCPIKASGDYVIDKYTFPTQKIPPGIPSGKVLSDLELYEPGKKPYVTIHVEADFSHQIPGLGR